MEVESRFCEVDLLGHCTFCQGKLASGNKDGGADHNDNGDEERSFDHIWTYLFRHGGDYAAGVKYVFKDGDESSVPVYQDVPPMCPCCKERIRELHRLHKELMRKVEDVRKIVIAAAGQSDKKSKKMGGLGEKLQNSALEPSVKVATLQFLHELVKACNKFQYIDRYEDQDEHDEELAKQGNSPSWKQPRSPNFLEQLPEDFLEDELEVKEESDSMSSRSSNYEKEVEDYLEKEKKSFLNENNDSDGGSDNEDDPATVSPNVGGDGEFTEENENDTSDVESEASSESMEEDEGNEAVPSCQEDSSADSEEEFSDLPSRRKKQLNIKKPKTKLKSHSHPILKQRCDLCKQRIPFKEIRHHLESHHNVQDYISKCPNPNCKYIYSNRRSLEALHFSSSSSGKKCREFADLPSEKKFGWFRKCERCDFRHENIRAFKTHLILHENHEDLPKNFPCPIPECEERYAVTQSLELHISEHATAASMRAPKSKSSKQFGKSHQPCPMCPDKQQLQVGEEMTIHLKEAHDAQEIISCRQCPFVFCSREQLLKHLSRHKSDGILCDICDDGVKYPSHIRVLRHYLSKHQIGREFECEVCSKSFLYLSSLKFHQQAAHPELYPAPENVSKSPYDCDICKKPCGSEKRLTVHKIKAHGADDDPLKCKTCGRVYCDFTTLSRHMEAHAGHEYKCSAKNCDKIYSTRQILLAHIRLAHVVGKKACETCGKRFTNSTTLQRHIQNIHQGRKHLCSICGIQYRTAYSLEVHMRTHTGLKPYQCSKCGLRFHDRHQFTCHTKKPTCDPTKIRRAPRKKVVTKIKAKAEVIQVPFNCEFCAEVCDTKKGLRNHIRSAHDLETKGCKTCGKQFASKSILRRHVEDVHLGRKYLCSVCGAELSSVNSLALHMKIHTSSNAAAGEPSGDGEGTGTTTRSPRAPRTTFKCNIEGCQQKFPAMKQLLDHKEAVHGSWKKFVCETCGKSFATERYLRQHNKRDHLGLLETFNCDSCGKGLVNKMALRDHKMTHTGERPLSCHICGQPFRTNTALKKHLKRHEEQGEKFQPRGAFKTYKGRPC